MNLYTPNAIAMFVRMRSDYTVSLSNIVDMYYLAALGWETRDASTRAREKLHIDITEAESFLLPRLSRALRDYLFAAAVGEARNAGKFVTTHRIPELPPGPRALPLIDLYQYEPRPALRVLFDLFSYFSAPNYGGIKWRQIVEIALSYDTFAPLVFIDQAVNAYHNGGLAFNKDEAFYAAQMCNTGENFSVFVQTKADRDILERDHINQFVSLLSPVVRKLIQRFFVTYQKLSIDFDDSPNTWPKNYVPREYGKKRLTSPQPSVKVLSHTHRLYGG